MWNGVPLQAQRVVGSREVEALFAQLAGAGDEVLAFAYLGPTGELLGLRHACSASRDRIAVPIRAVAADALSFDARSVVMAHNHPGGDPAPSAADCDATRLLARALDLLQVRLLDHLIVAAQGVTSFRRLGLL